jgi:hypothetical protein
MTKQSESMHKIILNKCIQIASLHSNGGMKLAMTGFFLSGKMPNFSKPKLLTAFQGLWLKKRRKSNDDRYRILKMN